jgi:Uma2 family endonuclease
MTTVTKPRRANRARFKPPASFPLRRWTVEQYHELIDKDILTADDKVELLDGWIVEKMPQKPPHASSTQRLQGTLYRVIPTGWDCRCQLPITLATSEPEPDLAIVSGDAGTYQERHPYADDIGLLIEITRTSIFKDRVEKARIYAEAKIPEYWIVYVSKGMIEVFSKPANGKECRYRQVKQYFKDDSIPLVLRGKKIADIPLRDILK